MSKVYSSPIKYAGAKRWLFRKIIKYLKNETIIVSPFVGGATIELNLAMRGKKVLAYDADTDLVRFWNAYLTDCDKIISESKEILNNHSTTELAEIKKKDNWRHDPTWFYIFNKLSYSNKPDNYVKKHYIIENEHYHIFKDGKPRRVFALSKNLLADRYKCLDLHIAESDFEDTLNNHKDILAYCDPPYLTTEYLYSINKQGFEHERLAEALDKHQRWILSYNDHPAIRELYKGYRIIETNMLSTFRKNNKAVPKTELLIFSNSIDVDKYVTQPPKFKKEQPCHFQP